ncbi:MULTISPECIES: DUF2750 domain-containing protein [Acinetobacter]|uniref:DUF2750 domain-containing protein n=2 Tax=Acinetobacter TaxID=469 RepID=A0A1V2UWA7_9GAMM|nr:DUF2750 domain-containing protein [Acinetobacter genomosp. 33YU]ONN53869.1 hypothetical protein AC058_13380 [Acinetobacter genomosp. 33YU]
MKISQKQIDAVIALEGAKRYKHFIKVIADTQEVWGLYKDGWALAGTEDNQKVFPVWPAKEYAELCAEHEWGGYEAELISLDDFMNELLPTLKDDEVLIGIFYTPLNNGVTPEIEEVLNDLELELENY